MHDSVAKPTAKIYRKKDRMWPSDRSDPPMVHASVVERHGLDTAPVEGKPGSQSNVKYEPWILKGDYQVVPWKRASSSEVTWHP